MDSKPQRPDITEENLSRTQFTAVPWQYNAGDSGYDADGFPTIYPTDKDLDEYSRSQLSKKCYQKFHRNPHVNTSIRGLAGRMCGNGFAVVSDIREIQDAIEEIETDYRNRLFDYWPKYVVRAYISGELFICFTCHKDGFIEVDFVDPDVVEDSEVDHGIIFHPNKTRMPLVYCIKDTVNGIEEQVPSIYLARYPELLNVAKKHPGFRTSKLRGSFSNAKAFRNIGKYRRFIVSWDLGMITRRSTSHMQTVLQWVNHWENLKKYEIDHKKSSGSYVWVVKFTDTKSWMAWLKLTDEQRAKTGIAAKKTPGGTMVLGPNMDLTATTPNLPKISGSDSDIMQMISSGLNEEQGVTTGVASGPYSSVKASRGPMSDRVSDEMAYFGRFLRYDFWGNIFFLKAAIAGFPSKFTVKEAVDFDDKKEPIIEKISKKPEQCIDVLFPVSAIENIEGQAKATLGVKHGSLRDTAGIPMEALMKKLGFHGYKKLRLQKATEDELYPEVLSAVDQESTQEKVEGEQPKGAEGEET